FRSRRSRAGGRARTGSGPGGLRISGPRRSGLGLSGLSGRALLAAHAAVGVGPPLRLLLPGPAAAWRTDAVVPVEIHDLGVREVLVGVHVRGALDGLLVVGDLQHVPVLARPGQGEDRKSNTSELQSRENLVCRLLLEKKKKP